MTCHRIVLILIVVVVSAVTCFKSFEIDGFKYYISDPVRTNWFNAMRHCTKLGMQLLDLETEEEYRKVQKYLIENVNDIRREAFWLSGTSLGTTDEFYWMESGAEIMYNGFNSDNLHHAVNNEFCLELRKTLGFTFNNQKCDYLNYFVCRLGKYESPRPIL